VSSSRRRSKLDAESERRGRPAFVRPEHIAIIGMSCRFPGARGIGEFCDLLFAGRDAVVDGPFDAARTPHDAHSAAPGARVGAYVDEVAEFDADFFAISPREARRMDPRQRLMLELAWELFEDASVLPRAALRGSSTGVFVGAMGDDYALIAHDRGQNDVDHFTHTGTSRSLLAERVSHVFELCGPSIVIDTGQSSSLVAVHLACQSVRTDECRMAIAGGVHLNLSDYAAAVSAEFGGISASGRCFALDARADGYVRGEGGGLVLLKRLSSAIADGDSVHAVILGSSAMHAGDPGMLVRPSVKGQVRLLRAAYSRAEVDPAAVHYVELHGTGTPVGDPIEAQAVGTVIGSAHPKDALRVGSVKPNIGHLQAASGIAGLLKTVLAIRAGVLPASLNFEVANPGIDLAAGNLRVPGTSEPWAGHRARIAGVTSLSMAGMSCHVIVADAPPPPGHTRSRLEDPAVCRPGAGPDPASEPCPRPPVDRTPASNTAAPTLPTIELPAFAHAVARSFHTRSYSPGWRRAVPWVVTGHTRRALVDQARQLRDCVHCGDAEPLSVGWSLMHGREFFAHRAVAVGASREGLLDALNGLIQGAAKAHLFEGVVDETRSQCTVFVFPGQGSQWPGMARELLSTSPVFAQMFADCETALAPWVDWSLREAVGSPSAAQASMLDRIDVVQPALFAMMVSLAQMWQSWGVKPDAVVGHSQGEIAAAYIAGALTLPDAAKLVALRAKLLRSFAGTGAMASVALSGQAAARKLGSWPNLAVAAFNGPTATIVSGPRRQLEAFLDECTGQGVRVSHVSVDFAAHSAQMEAIREPLLAALDGIRPQSSNVAFYSTVTGTSVDTATLDGRYWYDNLRQPVRFDLAVKSLFDAGSTVFLENSPHPLLVTAIEDWGRERGDGPAVVVDTLRRDQGGLHRMLSAAARLFTSGVPIAWPATLADCAPQRVRLPGYPFQRRHYWLSAAEEEGPQLGQHAPAEIGWREGFDDLSDFQQRRSVLRMVRAELAAVLGHREPDWIDVDQDFHALGVDSALGAETRHRLDVRMRLNLPADVLFNHPTPRLLSSHLHYLVTRVGDEPDRTKEESDGSGRSEAGKRPSTVGR
jgi:polyketide synthase 12